MKDRKGRKVRFIRKGGRIVPIRWGKGAGRREKIAGRAAGAGAAATLGGGAAALAFKGRKRKIGLGLAGLGLVTGYIGRRQQGLAYQAHKKRFARRNP